MQLSMLTKPKEISQIFVFNTFEHSVISPELDLRIHVRESADGHQLPPEIFSCERLEVLKLDVNLPVDQVSTTKYFHLPNLKLLHLCVSHTHIYEDGGFVSRLVSCCPSLENLTVQAFLNSHIQSICISSSSLRILKLQINTCDVDNTDILLIHTPELEYLFYSSNQALHQSITKMDPLVKADIYIGDDLQDDDLVVSCQNVLNFISSCTSVHHLSLHGPCTEGLTDTQSDEFEREELQLEQEMCMCRTGLALIPWCCRFHLKKIVIKNLLWESKRNRDNPISLET